MDQPHKRILTHLFFLNSFELGQWEAGSPKTKETRIRPVGENSKSAEFPV